MRHGKVHRKFNRTAEHGALGQGRRGIGVVGCVRRLAGIALVQLGQLARGVVAVVLDAAVEADFFDEVVGCIVGEAGGGAFGWCRL